MPRPPLPLEQWSRGDASRAEAALDASRPDAKHFRDLFAALARDPGAVSRWARARAGRLARASWNARSARHHAWIAKREKELADALNMDSRDAAAAAGSEAGVLTLAQLDELPAIGSLAPASSAEARLARFLERREDPSWARRLRREHGSFFVGDPMLLALLRRVEPERAAETLDCVLLCAALAGGGVEAALSLGADPLRRCAFDWDGSPVNLLGALLRMSPAYALSSSVPDIFFPAPDAILEQSVHLALACSPAAELPRALSLLADGAARPAGWLGACALSASRGHLRCARLLLGLGDGPSEPQIRAARARRPDPMAMNISLGLRFPPRAAMDWAEFDALAEARLLDGAALPARRSRSARRP